MANDSTGNLISEADRKKAEVFFTRARTVAESGQYDYAIEMYLQGLKLDPQNAEAHMALRKVSLARKATGGKPIGTFKAMGLRKNTKDDLQNMLNAEQLLAHDPGNTGYMLQMAQAAAAGGYRQAALWIGPILLRANLEGNRQDAATFTKLKEIYKQIGEWKLAIDAAGYAAAAKPDDPDLQHELKELAANQTIVEGQYGTGDFRRSVRNADEQRALQEQDADVRTAEGMAGIIARARAEYAASPDQPGKLMRLVEALVKIEAMENENEAIDLLESAFARTRSYRFQYAAGEIRLKQLMRFERRTKEEFTSATDDAEKKRLKAQLAEMRQDRLAAELDHYQVATKAYPTDLRLKYEVGRRLFELGRFDEAIPMLQQAQSDAKVREEAGILLGRAFLDAEFVDEAVETLRTKIEAYKVEGDERAKELYYWYGRALEAHDDRAAAGKAFSQIAQWDFGYRDVQQRIKALRAKASADA